MIWSRRAEVAQLVEQLIRNEQVVGSSPIFGSTTQSRRLCPDSREDSRIGRGGGLVGLPEVPSKLVLSAVR